ncbi:MAG: beta-ketoacyl-[acyl-carrier-protein] synthase family protein [Candidatus Omnitrophota bacterium]|jgi:3-oxoacyl-[acyl-carrier-protein] synthase II
MKKRIVITGLGVVSSIGIGRDAFWENLIKGKSGISKVVAFDTSGHTRHYGGEIKDFRPENFIAKKKIKLMGRTSQLAVTATHLALEDAKLNMEAVNHCKICVCIGTTMGESQLIEYMSHTLVRSGQKEINKYPIYQSPANNIPSNVALEFKLQGMNRIFTTACAAGNYAIGYGFDLLQSEEADMVIAGGSDAFSWIAFTGFNKIGVIAPDKCQPFDKDRKGMIPGEGAGVVIIESLESAIKRGANIYAEILGYGLSCDAYHMTNPRVEGVAQCMRNALKEAEISADKVDYISAHGTGTLHNDRTEAQAINEVFNRRKVAVSSIKSMLGHTMGAASAIEAIACCLTIKNNIIPPTINYEIFDPECDIDCVPNEARRKSIGIVLNNGFAFGGNNACLVLSKISN